MGGRLSSYSLFTDGACTQNPGTGGYGLILLTPDNEVFEFGGREENTTNNRMELWAVLRGFQEVYRLAEVAQRGRELRIVSDSKYVLEGLERHLARWSRQGWKLSTGDDVKNRDLWERLLNGKTKLSELGFLFRFELVKGHSGHEANERADQIAVAFCKSDPVTLFRGGVADYPVSLKASHPFEPVYLSWVDGVLGRHATWAECQKAVEGKSGARYKKVKNRLEEQETLRTWRVPASS